MWTTVRSKQQPSNRRKFAATAPSGRGLETSPMGEGTLPVSSRRVSSEVKSLREAARALGSMSFIQRDVVIPLKKFLHERAGALDNVHIVALGIGPFSLRESPPGFLQMALLLLIRTVCERFMLRLAKQKSSPSLCTVFEEASSSRDAGLEAAKKTVTSTFFDPAVTDLHVKCCDRLGVTVDSCNRYGMYTPSGSHSLLIAYLPHTPWALLRNLLVSNLVPYNPLVDGTGSQERLEYLLLRHVLIIGNDVHGKVCASGEFLERIGTYLRSGALRWKDDWKKHAPSADDSGSDDGILDVPAGTPTGPRGVGRHDIALAFSDTAVMQLDTERESQLLLDLRRLRLPKIVRSGDELS
ncbi:hypothetical protein ERJ75_001830100 [Trypanosoma vivax]|uniref:SRR1-like domain-containing protein n=1 Tax=Trypanosoma vivax (strain Y486) TaxID=1055687 RepID=G0U944_TRYVY|nr:hypothetical protein TRVL_07495 [Trypanosoma vivax]KAH8603440.1 hypothetical protein ERJ75_001830100 [Trypanosoma vivax]CCC54128.1 conserved hypothetical protein [Trypanosoma vivax Y486]